MFEYEDPVKFVTDRSLATKYWQMSKVVVVFAFFRGSSLYL